MQIWTTLALDSKNKVGYHGVKKRVSMVERGIMEKMTRKVILIIMIMSATLFVGCGSKESTNNSSTMEEGTTEQRTSVEFLEKNDNEDGALGEELSHSAVLGYVVKKDNESITLKVVEFVVDSSAPNGFHLNYTEEERTFLLISGFSVWTYYDRSFLRISYEDMDAYEAMRGYDVIWAVSLDDDGKVKNIFEPYIP